MLKQVARGVVSKLKTTNDTVQARKVGQVINKGTTMQNSQQVVRIAVDSGNGAGKIWLQHIKEDGETVESYIVIPSYIQTVDEVASYSDDGGITFGYRYDESPSGEETGFCRLVGQRVARNHSGGLSTIQAYGRKTQEAISFIVGAILSLDSDSLEFDIDVVASVISPAMGNYIREALNGTHQITVAKGLDEVQLTLRINIIKVVPEGGAMAAACENVRRSTLIDIGHGTAIVTSFENSAKFSTRQAYNLGTSSLVEIACSKPGINMAASVNGDAALRRYLIENALITGSPKSGYTYAGTDITSELLEASEEYAYSSLAPVWDEAVRIHRNIGLNPVLIGGGAQIPAVVNALKGLKIGGKVHTMKRGDIKVPERFFNVASMFNLAGW